MPKRLELSDRAYREHVQGKARERQAKRSQRLIESGNKQLMTWIPETLYRQAEQLASQRGESFQQVIPVIIHAGIQAIHGASITKPSTPESEPATLPAVDPVIAELAAQGMKPSGIAEELNRRGYRTAAGNLYRRDHDKIKKAVKAA